MNNKSTKRNFSSAIFALVDNFGDASYNNASGSGGVRPKFWLVR